MAEKTGTKLCKHCKTEIPVGAKVCPNCRKKQGGALKYVVITFVAICIIGAAASGKNQNDDVKRADSSNTEPRQDQKEDQSNERLTFKVGETAEYKDIKVTLLGVTESNGSNYNKPEDGNIFVIAEFEIENNSEKELSISSILSFDAYQDGYSTSLSLSALIEKTGEQLDGSIATGKKMKGSIGYEIPSDYKELEINLQLNVWSSKKIVFVYEK